MSVEMHMISTESHGGSSRSSGNRLLFATVIAMVLGVASGWSLSHVGLAAVQKENVVRILDLVTQMFLRLIRMIVAPLVLSTLVSGIAQMGGAASVGKIGIRSLLWFLSFSLVAICTGLVLVNLFAPGEGLMMSAHVISDNIVRQQFDAFDMVEQIIPTSIIDAMAGNHVLQIVVFAVFVGIAVGTLGDDAIAVRTLAGQVSSVMLKVAAAVMRTAPVAVFAALASTTLSHGLSTIVALGRLVGEFYLGLSVMACLITLAGAAFIGRKVFTLIAKMREPLLIAFSTASSEAAFPASFKAIQAIGVSQRIIGLVLPLGYAFNLDGTLVYSGFCTIFIAQAYGIHLDAGRQVALLLFLMFANKGAAGVPRGALVSLAITIQTFDLPVAGIGLILGVDAIMDMGRTTINVFGNAMATAAVARMSGEIDVESHGDLKKLA